eukprot:scaffold116912_cov66-Phaeocystis_antarctica.AAC.4
MRSIMHFVPSPVHPSGQLDAATAIVVTTAIRATATRITLRGPQPGVPRRTRAIRATCRKFGTTE